MPINGIVKRKIEFVSKQVNAITGRIAISFDQEAYHPGDTVIATISLRLRNPIDGRSLDSWISCIQTVKKTSTRIMDAYDYREDKDVGIPRSTHLRTTQMISERVAHREKKRLGGGGKYSNSEYSVEFRLPQSANHTRHSYGHDNVKTVWKIGANLDVPLAMDISALKEIIVRK